jgi:hypothetical protein
MQHACRSGAQKSADTVAAMTGHYNEVHLPLFCKAYNLMLGRMLTHHDLLERLNLFQTPSLIGKPFMGATHSIMFRICIIRGDLFIRAVYRKILNDMQQSELRAGVTGENRRPINCCLAGGGKIDCA